jgi:PAS domain S-box-containing protein
MEGSAIASAPAVSPSAKVRRRIMIVEDEALIALDLERRLLGLGYDVVGVADDFDDAVALFREQTPDLVLMDINLRGTADGIEIAGTLKKIADTPVIFVTAYNDDQTVKRATASSPYGYLIKPFDDRTLAVNISIALERHAADRRMRVYSAAMDSATVGIVIIDVQGSEPAITYANEAYVKMSGYPLERLQGSRPCFLAADPQDEQVRRVLDAVENRAEGNAVFHAKRAGGEQFWVSVSVAPVRTESAQPRHLLAFSMDVTRQQDAERALAQKQRLELVGQLSAGIAHDFNNVLGAIIAFAEIAQQSASIDDCRGDIQEVIYAAKSGARLTRKLLDISRPGPEGPMKSSELSKVVQRTRPMVERIVGQRVKVDLQIDPQPMMVGCDETSLEQVLLNLVSNARDAMGGAGRLSIVATTHAPTDAAGPYRPRVHLAVTDSGAGMEPALVSQIFEPFFTTKAAGVGTGLGLATTKMLVERAGGTISVRSAPGQGTTFLLDFPMTEGVIEDLDPQRYADLAGRAQGALCLLVEDEPGLRRAYSRALEHAGFSVVEASNCATALQQLAKHASDLRLVISDMVLPDDSGAIVIERAKSAAPSASRVVITGYFDESGPGVPADVPLIWKPCSTAVVARAALHAINALAPAEASTTAVGTPAPTGPAPKQAPSPEPGAVSTTSAAPASPDGSLGGSLVLIVDDDEPLRTALAHALRAHGLRALEAGSAAAAIELIERHDLHLVVSDINLPDRNGLDLLQVIREKSPRLPMIVMSGGLSNENARRAIDGRVTAFLAKPVSVAEFVREAQRTINEGYVARLQHELLLSKAPPTMLADLQTTERQFEESLSQLYMAYQPIVRAHDRSIFSHEALLRSRGPLGTPDKIIVAAEVLGRVDRLGRAIRRSIADTLAAHPETYEPIFVNLHPSELRAELLASEDEPMLPHASRIVLEVTERAQLSSTNELSSTLERLRDAGYRIALDDLGEGYAGLTWLVRLTPHFAKLDMSLVRDIHVSKIKRDLVASLVSVCRRAGTAVVAEGVENAAEATVLTDIGCDLLQGYYFARPGPPFPSVG